MNATSTRKRKIGIIAGNGLLPKLIEDHCIKNTIECSFAFIDEAPKFKMQSDFIVSAIGQVGKILSFFKKHAVTHIVLAGGVTKPNFSQVKVDFKGGILLTKILKNKLLGDNSLLTTIIRYIESFGYHIISVDELLPNLHLSAGNNNNVIPYKAADNDIKLGIKLITDLSIFDVGQSAIIQNGRVIAIEAAEGTDNMILRSKKYIENNVKHPAILIKLKKTSQDRRIDLPTIGVKTIENIVKSNIKGIILDANNTIVINRKELLKISQENNIFIYGVET